MFLNVKVNDTYILDLRNEILVKIRTEKFYKFWTWKAEPMFFIDLVEASGMLDNF